MKHEKTWHKRKQHTPNGVIEIEGPVTAAELETYHFHNHLTTFRAAPKQFATLKNIARLPEGRIIIARTSDTIIGYVAYLYPDPLERWSEFAMDNLLVLGGIEVIPEYRQANIGSGLLEVSMMDDYMENYIIISTEYYWHWDLKGMQLNVWQYRQVMEKMMAKGGLTPMPTDDPEIMSHPANCLMVRIGKNVPEQSIKLFAKLRFLQRHRYRK
ncbi:MAG TPA: GNAT family N-acetyltransferase [Bacillota bacterium]|nr:GNAT family N-acetyltransferase [Bacillota bacterium]